MRRSSSTIRTVATLNSSLVATKAKTLNGSNRMDEPRVLTQKGLVYVFPFGALRIRHQGVVLRKADYPGGRPQGWLPQRNYPLRGETISSSKAIRARTR